MPIYQTICEVCSAKNTIWCRVADRDSLPECLCGGILSRQISAPFVSVDIPAYVSPASGRVISSRTQMRDDLARTGHIMNEPGLKNDISRWKTESDEKAFAPVAAAVDATVTSLVNSGSIES